MFGIRGFSSFHSALNKQTEYKKKIDQIEKKRKKEAKIIQEREQKRRLELEQKEREREQRERERLEREQKERERKEKERKEKERKEKERLEREQRERERKEKERKERERKERERMEKENKAKDILSKCIIQGNISALRQNEHLMTQYNFWNEGFYLALNNENLDSIKYLIEKATLSISIYQQLIHKTIKTNKYSISQIILEYLEQDYKLKQHQHIFNKYSEISAEFIGKIKQCEECPITNEKFQKNDIILVCNGCFNMFTALALHDWYNLKYSCPMCISSETTFHWTII